MKLSKEEEKQKWFKQHNKCNRCGSNKELCIHHIDPNDRTTNQDIWSLNKQARLKELEKCIVVCKECHVDIHTEMKRTGKVTKYHKDRKLIFCSKCNKEKPLGHKEKQLCRSCYRDYQRKNKYIICDVCKKTKHPFVGNKCNACYSKERRTSPPNRKLAICKNCNKNKYHEAKGLCKQCYKRFHYEKIKKLVICESCKEEKPHHSKGLCAKCYMREKRRKK